MATWTTSNSVLTMTLTVTEDSTNLANNTSSVSWTLQITADNTWFTGRQIYWSVNIGGLTKSATNTVTASQGQTVTMGAGNGTITHNSDGSKTIACTAHAERSGSWSSAWSDLDISQSMALTSLARYSTPGVVPSSITLKSGTIQDSFTVGFDVKSASYYYLLTVTLPGKAELARWVIHGAVGGHAQVWTPSADIIQQFDPDSTTQTVQFNLVTYKSSTMTEANRLGTTMCRAVVKSSPSIHSPVISNVTMIENTDELVNYGVEDDELVKLLSEKVITCDLTLYTTIQNAQVGCGSAVSALEASGGSYTATLHEPDGEHIYIDVLDTRGYSKRYEVPCTVVDYGKPLITVAEVERVTPTGGAVTGKIKGRIFGGYVGEQENTFYLSYQWKENAEGAVVTNVTQVSAGEITEEGYADFNWTGTLLTSFDYRKAYLIRFTLADEYGFYAASSEWLPVYEGIPVFSWGKDHFDVYGELHIHDREDPENIYSVIKPTEMAVKVQQMEMETSSALSGNTDTTVTLDIPADLTELLALIPYGATPLSGGSWGTVCTFNKTVLYDQNNILTHTVVVHPIGSTNQKYVIRYVVIYR